MIGHVCLCVFVIIDVIAKATTVAAYRSLALFGEIASRRCRANCSATWERSRCFAMPKGMLHDVVRMIVAELVFWMPELFFSFLHTGKFEIYCVFIS